MDIEELPSVCVLDASTYVGFWILKGLLSRGYTVHAAIQKFNGKLSPSLSGVLDYTVNYVSLNSC